MEATYREKSRVLGSKTKARELRHKVMSKEVRAAKKKRFGRREGSLHTANLPYNSTGYTREGVVSTHRLAGKQPKEIQQSSQGPDTAGQLESLQVKMGSGW